MYSYTISSILERFHHYLDRNLLFCRDHRAARVSAFWTQHFNDRSNFPKVPDLMSFRQGDFLYGIGDTKQSSAEQKQREFEEIRKSIALFTPDAFVVALREPYFGAPLVFQNGTNWQSSSFILNAGTTWRVSELLKCYGPQGRGLHACEIGAGWGACAYQLHQATDILSYTIIDLPENLCLSSTYLTAALPDRATQFVDCGPGALQAPAQAALYFGLPPAIDRLSGPYDLILNTVSLQEMDRETVLEYLGWASRSLAGDGVLVSFNSHDKEGVRRPSEYLTTPLELLHMRPFRKVPAGFFNTIPYEMVFRKTSDAKQDISVGVDALGEMMQLGLDSQLADYTEALLNRQSGVVTSFLSDVREFFYAADEERRAKSASGLLTNHRSAASTFLVANWQFAIGDFLTARQNLEESLLLGLADFARVRACVMLSLLGTRDLPELEELSGGLLEEILQILERQDISSIQNQISRVIDCPVYTPRETAGFMRWVNNRLTRFMQR